MFCHIYIQGKPFIIRAENSQVDSLNILPYANLLWFIRNWKVIAKIWSMGTANAIKIAKKKNLNLMAVKKSCNHN